jgi:uncharacterized membrane protein YfcA
VSLLAANLSLSLVELLAGALILFLAGLVRGFSGFGFSMVAVTGLSLLRPPAEIIPMVLSLEVLASLHLMSVTWREADWRSLRWLLAGMTGATPFGVLLLATVPANPMRVVVSLLVLSAALLLMSGWRLQRRPGPAATLATGALSGFLNGVASIAGPPVIVFYLSSPAAVSVSRASLIAFFLGCDIIALAAGGAAGLITPQTGYRVVAFLVPVAGGVVLGQRGFHLASPDTFRRVVLALLVILSLAGLLRALWE